MYSKVFIFKNLTKLAGLRNSYGKKHFCSAPSSVFFQCLPSLAAPFNFLKNCSDHITLLKGSSGEWLSSMPLGCSAWLTDPALLLLPSHILHSRQTEFLRGSAGSVLPPCCPRFKLFCARHSSLCPSLCLFCSPPRLVRVLPVGFNTHLNSHLHWGAFPISKETSSLPSPSLKAFP